MKGSLFAITLFCFVLALTLSCTDARKRKGSNCVHDISDVQNNPCDNVTAIQRVNFTLSNGNNNPRCRLTMEKKQICLGCKYTRNKQWGACVDGFKTKKELLNTDKSTSDECPAERTVTRKCRNNNNNHVGGGNKKCRYSHKAKWSQCRNGMRSKTLRLRKRKSDESCPTEKLVTRKCNGGRKNKRRH